MIIDNNLNSHLITGNLSLILEIGSGSERENK